jgi:hypothetical protein
MPESAVAAAAASTVVLRKVCACRGVRVLAWDGDILYAARGYELVRWNAGLNRARTARELEWESVARFHPAWWRNLTARAAFSSRLVRDGFHALAILNDKNNGRSESGKQYRIDATMIDATIVAAVPGAIVTRTPGSHEFQVTHKIRRGTRPLHITTVPDGILYWGEYFDNRERAEVHIFASADCGESWHVAYTFPAGAIRHVHNIVYDRWEDCLWILTGDEGAECKVLRASCDFHSVGVVLAGNQQARAVAAIPMPDALYLATDTPFETNHVLRLTRDRRVEAVGDLESSSIFGCRVGEAIFFSTMVEPSALNRSREVQVIGSADRDNEKHDWQVLARWQKDKWPMRYFQYGNAFLPDGENTTNYLATTTIAVERDDMVTTIWKVECSSDTPLQRPLST